MDALSRIFRENEFTAEELPAFEKKLFFKGARQRPYLVRFTVLLFLATVIASGGIFTNSTATVIGAMIIAPLMTPIVATAAAFVTGSMDRATRSLLLVLAGVALAIIVSWLMGILHPGVVSFTKNPQITGRVSPDLMDLIVALGILLVSVPLVSSSLQVARKSIIEFQTTQVAKEWIAPSGYEFTQR